MQTLNSESKHPSRTAAWIEAMRLRTLPVSVAGVLGGAACAILLGGFNWLPCLICLLFAVVAQIASNFANEYYDYANGLDRKGREGFRRGVTEGDLSPAAMKRATYLLLVLDSMLGCSLIYWGGWWLIPVGIAIAIFALAYSTGPYPLSHHGLGDVAVIIFFGIVPVMFTTYVQTGSFSGWPLTLSIGVALGMLAANVLIVNNYRDMEADHEVGKRTTVVIFGRRTMGILYICFGFAALIIIGACTSRFKSYNWMAAWGAWMVVYARLFLSLKEKRGTALNAQLKRTALTMLGICITLLIISIS